MGGAGCLVSVPAQRPLPFWLTFPLTSFSLFLSRDAEEKKEEKKRRKKRKTS
jgi:hypothetical protein